MLKTVYRLRMDKQRLARHLVEEHGLTSATPLRYQLVSELTETHRLLHVGRTVDHAHTK